MKALKNFVLTGIAASVIALSGCQIFGGNENETPDPYKGRITQSADWYANQARNSSGEQRFKWKMKQIRKYIADDEAEKAKDMISALSKEAKTDVQKAEIRLLCAEYYNNTASYDKVLKYLKGVSTAGLPREEAAYLYIYRAKASAQTGNTENAVNNYIRLNSYLKGDSLVKNQKDIVNVLAGKQKEELEAMIGSASDELRRGYLQLAYIRAGGAEDADDAEEQWVKDNPTHPGRLYLDPDTDMSLIKIASAADSPAEALDSALAGHEWTGARHIAVLMPLSGKFGSFGEAFRSGVETYRGANPGAQISYYDTNGKDVIELYNNAMAQGAEFIIGPLLKENVARLSEVDTTVPVIFINSNDGSGHGQFQYFYALSPEDEGIEAALKIRDDGYTHPAVIIPDQQKGSRVAESFLREWRNISGSSSVPVIRFRDRISLKDTIASGISGEHRPDSYYIYASPLESSVIRQEIKSITGKSPECYITGRSNPGISNASVERTMAGMKLGDMPWMLQSSDLRRTARGALRRSSSDTLKFFALGYDSLMMVPNIRQLDSGSSVEGLTGTITISGNGTVKRGIQWITIGDSRFLSGKVSTASPEFRSGKNSAGAEEPEQSADAAAHADESARAESAIAEDEPGLAPADSAE